MTELPPEAAALIERARQAHGPRQVDRDRVLTGLHTSLGIGAATAVAAASASATASAAESAALGKVAAAGGQGAALGWKGALFTWKAGKVMLATMALGGAIGVGAVSRTPHAPEASVRSAASPVVVRAPASPAPFADPSMVDAQQLAQPHVEASTQLSPAQPAELGMVEAPLQPREPGRAAEPVAPPRGDGTRASAAHDAPVAQGSAARTGSRLTRRRAAEVRASQDRASELRAESRAAASSSAATAATAASTVSPLRAEPEPSAEPEQQPAQLPAAAQDESELALVRRALTSLRDRDAERALALLADHAARYPSGAFATERRGLRVVALCAAGLVDQGQREQAAFLREAGSSPIAARVRSACPEDGQ